MEELKDINGLPFKGGCSFEDKNHNICDVLKVREEELLYCCPARDVTGKYPKYMLVQDKCRILNYRELAPDKNGKMICEGDRANSEWVENLEVLSYIDSRFILKNSMGQIFACPQVTFVSRPTDEPDKKKEELQARIKLMEEAHEREGEEIARLKKEVGL